MCAAQHPVFCVCRRSTGLVAVCATLIAFPTAADAVQPVWYVHTGGLSYHFQDTRAPDRKWRDQHAGLGFERRRDDGDGMEMRWTGGVMQDSRSYWGGYAGAAYMKRWRWNGVADTGLGVGAYAIYRSKNWRGDMALVPAVLPSASINSIDHSIGFNFIYVPKLGGSEATPSVLFTQMVVSFR